MTRIVATGLSARLGAVTQVLFPVPTSPLAGIIGTNLVDAEQTVDTMVQTQGSFQPIQAATPGAAGLRALLQSRGVQASRCH